MPPSASASPHSWGASSSNGWPASCRPTLPRPSPPHAARKALCFWAMLALLLLLGDPISFQLKNDVPVGQKPTLTVQAIDRVRDLRIELDGGGAHVSLSQAAMGPGDRQSFPIGDGNAGKTHWKGKISAVMV